MKRATSWILLCTFVPAHIPAAGEPDAVSVSSTPAQTGEPGIVSVWDGVYSEAQALRGAENYDGPCGRCHGFRLDGQPDDPDMIPTPPIGGPKFLRNWEGRTLAALMVYTRATMPENNPGYLTDQELVDLIAYSLKVSDVPAGNRELSTNPGALSRVVIRQE